jgi:xanthine dehydrogenase small subunit
MSGIAVVANMDLMSSMLQSDLIFFVNGIKIIRRHPNPRMLLAEFLREDLKLTGTKIACGEGGCGSCTVLLSRFDRQSSTIVHCSANACLTPICSLHGLAVTTVEALGSTRTQLHPIQERLVKAHGIQCGFCSPGMVMSIYALLRNNPKPSHWQIEHAIKGNLCRCTGYRPILDAFGSFAKDSDSIRCPMGDRCCKKRCEQETTGLVDSKSEFCLHDDTQELIFPSELQLSDKFHQQSVEFGSQSDVVWYHPISLKELLTLRKLHPESRLAAGCTTIAFSLKSFTAKPAVIISTSRVPELNVVSQKGDEEIFIGANTTVTQLEDLLSSVVQKLPELKTRLAVALLDMLKVFASPQIRNVAKKFGVN